MRASILYSAQLNSYHYFYIILHFLIGSLAWKYISNKIPTDVSYTCFNNIDKLHIQSNNLPQVRLNV